MSARRLRLADLIAPLSHVTDLGMGHPPGNAARVCLVAVELARRLNVSDQLASDIYYIALLQHIGCTAYAHETAIFFGGNDIAVRAEGARVDFTSQMEVLSFLLLRVARDTALLPRLKVIARALRAGPAFGERLDAANCEVAVATARRLGMGTGVEAGLQHIYERWDGKGGPRHEAADDIAVPARFTQVASQAVLFHQLGGWELAAEMATRRSGSMLDPEIAAALLQHGAAIMAMTDATDPMVAVLDAEPGLPQTIAAADLDQVAGAFGDVVDLKSPFTHGHAGRVAALAEAAARRLKLPDADIQQIRQAGLLHDLGRVAVPNGIWEKPDHLTSLEWEDVRLHPYYSERILSRSSLLAPLGVIAGMHHERLDGSGFHRQLSAPMIPIAARVLATADMFQGRTEERAFRPAFSPQQAAAHLETGAREGRLDAEVVRTVLDAAGEDSTRVRQVRPAGLTDREIEVLRLAARGMPNREIGRLLSISPKTADHHVQHIYTKLGVSTRAGIAIFAMEHDLLAGHRTDEIG